MFSKPSQRVCKPSHSKKKHEVIDKIRESGADVAECAIKPMGLDVPFWVVHLLDYLQLEEEEEEEEAIYEEEIVVDPDRGEFTCPICWLRFDRSDVLSIATHEDLRAKGICFLSKLQFP